MNDKINQLRMKFNNMDVHQKYAFITKLQSKLVGKNAPEWHQFLGECITNYTADLRNFEKKDHTYTLGYEPPRTNYAKPGTFGSMSVNHIPTAIKKHRKIALVASLCVLFVAAGVFALIMLFRGGDLDGTWVLQGTENDPVPVTFEFSGNRYTITQGIWPDVLGWRTDFGLVTDDDINNSRFIGQGREYGIGRRHTLGHTISLHRAVSNGMFTISNSSIEFVLSDGYVVVASFSRTENTIDINDLRFRRMTRSDNILFDTQSPTITPSFSVPPAPAAPEWTQPATPRSAMPGFAN